MEHLLEHLIEQRQAICAAEIECRVNSELTNQQWLLVEKVVKVLKPFEEATVAVSSEGASAALTIPIVNSLTHFLRNTAKDDDDKGVQTMKRKMLSSLNTRFASMETNKLYVLPTMLDPWFKVKNFSSS